jgi:hypothetical protein
MRETNLHRLAETIEAARVAIQARMAELARDPVVHEAERILLDLALQDLFLRENLYSKHQ